MDTSDPTAAPGEPGGSADAPLVSIGLPVLNGGSLLRRALEDLTAQTWPNLEIVVSDNASTDATADIAAEFAALHPTVRVARSETRLDMIDSFARALALTTGTYFMWAAHDDMWEPGYVAALAVALEADAEAAIAAGIPHLVTDDRQVIRAFPDVAALTARPRAERLDTYVRQREDLGKANIVYGLLRRQWLVDLDPTTFLRRAEHRLDYHLNLALLARGPLVVVPEVRFLKTSPPTAPRRLPRLALDVLRATARQRAWIDAYAGVLAELDLTPEERVVVDAAIRDRRRHLRSERIRHLVSRALGRSR